MMWSTDLRRSDVVTGVLVAGLVVGATAAGVAQGAAHPVPLLAEGEVAVRVRPVSEIPTRTHHPAPPPTRVSTTRTSTVVEPPAAPGPTSGGLAPADAVGGAPAIGAVPPRPVDAPPASAVLAPRPRGGIKALPRLSTPDGPPLPGVAAEPGFGPGGPGVAPGTADPAQSPNDPYAYVDPALEDPSVVAGGSGLVGGAEPPEKPGLDAAAEHAVAIFRQRLQRWISVHFIVTDAGLSAAERDSATVRAVIMLDHDHRLVDYEIGAHGHPALRAAAEEALQVLLGTHAPRVPEHYPGPVQERIRVTFRCTEATCD